MEATREGAVDVKPEELDVRMEVKEIPPECEAAPETKQQAEPEAGEPAASEADQAPAAEETAKPDAETAKPEPEVATAAAEETAKPDAETAKPEAEVATPEPEAAKPDPEAEVATPAGAEEGEPEADAASEGDVQPAKEAANWSSRLQLQQVTEKGVRDCLRELMTRAIANGKLELCTVNASLRHLSEHFGCDILDWRPKHELKPIVKEIALAVQPESDSDDEVIPLRKAPKPAPTRGRQKGSTTGVAKNGKTSGSKATANVGMEAKPKAKKAEPAPEVKRKPQPKQGKKRQAKPTEVCTGKRRNMGETRDGDAKDAGKIFWSQEFLQLIGKEIGDMDVDGKNACQYFKEYLVKHDLHGPPTMGARKTPDGGFARTQLDAANPPTSRTGFWYRLNDELKVLLASGANLKGKTGQRKPCDSEYPFKTTADEFLDILFRDGHYGIW